MATQRRARTKRLRAGLTGLYYNIKKKNLSNFCSFLKEKHRNRFPSFYSTHFRRIFLYNISRKYKFVTNFCRMMDLYGSLACGSSDPEITFKKI